MSPEVAEIDLIQDECMMSQGGMSTPEPFTETSATANIQNNEKLDITINSYSVDFQGTGAPQTMLTTSQTVTGKRCSQDMTRSCAVDSDCTFLGGGVGTCEASISPVQVLLADFTTKGLLFPDIGMTVNVVVRFFGSDTAGNNWVAQGTIAATLNDFDNCSCTLTP